MILPRTIYFAAIDFAKYGTFFTDPQDKMSDAVSLCMPDPGDEQRPFRIFCVEFCPDTNLPERIQDVTEEAVAEYNKFLASRGLSAIEDAA
jgi:hypothetical protein